MNPYRTPEQRAKSRELIQAIAGPTGLKDVGDTIHVLARVLASFQAGVANAKLRENGATFGDRGSTFDAYLLSLSGAFNVVYGAQIADMMEAGPRLTDDGDAITEWLRRQMGEEDGSAAA